MKRLMIGLLSGFLFLGAAVSGSYAEECGCGGHMGRGGMDEGVPMKAQMMRPGGHSPEAMHFLWRKLMRLNLTDKQKGDLKLVKSRVIKDTIKKRADLEVARIELRELLDKDSVDMGAVEAKLKKTESLRTEMHLSHIKAREEIKAILTPEQRKKFKEEIEESFMTGGGKHDDKGRGPQCRHNDDVQQEPGDDDAKK